MTAVESPRPPPPRRDAAPLRRRPHRPAGVVHCTAAPTSAPRSPRLRLARPRRARRRPAGLALIALVLALVELAGDAEQVAEQPAATATPVPTTTTVPTPTTTIPPATDDGSPGTTPEIADWPAGKDAWTVVLEASGTREAAEARANELAPQGIAVRVLDSNHYPRSSRTSSWSSPASTTASAPPTRRSRAHQPGRGRLRADVSPAAGRGDRHARADARPLRRHDAADALERGPVRREPLQRLRRERVALHLAGSASTGRPAPASAPPSSPPGAPRS